MSAMRAIELPELPATELPEERAPRRSRRPAQPAGRPPAGPDPTWTPWPSWPPISPPPPLPPASRPPGQRRPGQPARHQPPRAQVAPPPLRLTRRGKIVVALAAALLAAGLSLVIAASAQATSRSPGTTQQGLARVVVRPGQSLWSVAESADPNTDTRSVIQQIIELNGLSVDTVLPGQSLWVPRD